MKDFIGSVPKIRRARSKAAASPRPLLVKWLIAVVVLCVAVLLGWLLLRSLQWSDFMHTDSQETVLFLAEKVDQTGAYVVQFLFDDLAVDVYPIPADVPLAVAGGYGTYRFQAVYPLLILEGKELSYIRSAMSLSTGVLLDELWYADVSTLDFNSRTRLQTFLLRQFFSNHQVGLTQKLAWLALVFDQRTDYEVHEPLTTLPSTVFEQFNYGVEQSPCTVALINTTPLAGLAGRIATLLESHHFRVVRTTSDATSVERTTVLYADPFLPDCRLVMEKLEKLVPGGVVKQVDADETVRNRADLVVRLGTDLAQ